MQRPKTEQVNLNQPLKFYGPSGESLEVQARNLEITWQGGSIGECILQIEVPFDIYKTIETGHLFNLTSQVRGPNFATDFVEDKPFEIELGLAATLFKTLGKFDTDQIARHLVENQAGAAPLRRTENWYALNVTQADGPVKIGYQTSWAVEGSPIYGDVPLAAQSLFSAVTDFFESDDWPMTFIGDSTAVRLMYQGDESIWECIAETDEEKGHFAFYSLFPHKVADNKKAQVAEFLTRANYGLLLGNFEMDYSDGEVRFRTSLVIDEDEMLAPSTIRHLVYANVTAMNTYFPGLLAVLEKDVSPAEAISQIEEG